MARAFRADIVGSFLRPKVIQDARIGIDIVNKPQSLKVIEDVEIEKLVKKLVELGLKDVTDGEFRRSWWHFDFFWNLKGIKLVPAVVGLKFAHHELRKERLDIQGKIEYNPSHEFFESFEHLKKVTPPGITPKVCIPSGTVLLNRFDPDWFPTVYSSKEEFFNDIGTAYQKTIQDFYNRGLRYLQIDDTAWGGPISLYDKATSDEERGRILRIADNILTVLNLTLANHPSDLHVSMHICRGNNESDYLFSGAYDPVSTQISKVNVDTFFLEYDDERSGGFDILLPKIAANGKNQTVILGLITTKFAPLEDEALLISRIEQAAKYIPKERLGLSGQCGYASTEEGNKLTEEEQWAKVAHTIKVAIKVWGNL